MGFGIKLPKWDPVKSVQNITANPGKELRNVGQNLLGGVDAFTLGGAGTLAKKFVGGAPNAPNPGEDPNVTALRNKLYGEAGDFESHLGDYQKDASNQIEREGSQALESGVKGTRQNFNRRGLLYSGLREGAEQGVRGRVASTMASQKAQSNQELSNLSKSKWEKAAQVGLQSYQDSVNREAEIASVNLQNQVARAQMMQQLGQVGGYMATTAYGNRNVVDPNTGLNSNGTIGTTSSPYNSNQYRDVNGLNVGPFSGGSYSNA